MGYYDNRVPTRTVNVLGTDYRIYMDVPEAEDDTLKGCAGYCDSTVRRIIIAEKGNYVDIEDYNVCSKRMLRHEIIHAFLFESGLGADSVWYVEGQSHPEQTVDWFARQFYKLHKAFQEADAL